MPFGLSQALPMLCLLFSDRILGTAAATVKEKRRRAPHSKASLRAADRLWSRGMTAMHWAASSLTGGCRTGCLTWSESWLFRAAAAALECGALHRFPIPSRTSLAGGVLRRQQTCSPPAPHPLASRTDHLACEYRANSGPFGAIGTRSSQSCIPSRPYFLAK